MVGSVPRLVSYTKAPTHCGESEPRCHLLLLWIFTYPNPNENTVFLLGAKIKMKYFLGIWSSKSFKFTNQLFSNDVCYVLELCLPKNWISLIILCWQFGVISAFLTKSKLKATTSSVHGSVGVCPTRRSWPLNYRMMEQFLLRVAEFH